MGDEAWSGFFSAQVGATSALAGLVMVAISINLTRILSTPTLPGRSAEALIVLGAALIMSALMLTPAGSLPAWSPLALAIAAWLGPISFQLRTVLAERVEWWRVVWRFLLVQTATVPMLIGAWLVAAGDPSGASWLAIAILIALVVALLNTWVLMVEILR